MYTHSLQNLVDVNLAMVYDYAVLATMGAPKGPKLNQLQRLLPEGLVVDAAWLEARGYSRGLRSRYLTSGWLEQPVTGSYRRPGGKLLWQHVVVSLQGLLQLPVVVGGRTALELHGFSHYVSKTGQREVHLYGDNPLPGWVLKLALQQRLVFHRAKRIFRTQSVADQAGSVSWKPQEQCFSGAALPASGSLTRLSWGQWDWPLGVSTPERAILELLDEVPGRETFHQADKLMESLSTLSPRRLQRLLEECRNVKVKRLFLWFAKRHGFQWLPELKQERIDLGKGKRVLVRGGKLDAAYLITVPGDMNGGE